MNTNKRNSTSNNKLNILSEDVTNMIDSNKTITKFSTVVKELIENSIDANSKNISIFIKEGGLTLIELKDDGTGIEKDNFTKLCKRFNSSKLESYDDLQHLNTFGFRGEALSILSYISHLTILSKTELSDFGHEATFKDGNMITSLKTVTMEKGTLIRIENIFYNNLIRKKYYDKNEETKDIINLITKYSFHFHSVNFNLSTNIFSNKILTTGNINRISLDELATKRILSSRLFNQEIHDNLFHFNNNYNNNFDEANNSQNSEKNINNINNINLKTEIKFDCYFTKPSANLDKSYLMIFLNNRLIINNNIKKLFDQTYSKFLIKHGNYFVYLNIICPAHQIDVNVRANKSEVIFLNEDIFLSQLKILLEENLNEEINSKNYYVGEFNNFSNFRKKDEILYENSNNNFNNFGSANNTIFYAKDKVRVDTKNVSLEKYLININNTETSNNLNNSNFSKDSSIFDQCLSTIFTELFNSENNKNYYFTDILKNNHYVGYEIKNSLVFIQFNTSLFILNLKLLLEEYFLFLILNSENKNIINLKIKSDYKLKNIIDFIDNNCTNDDNAIFHIKNNLENVEKLISEKILLLGNINIKINIDNLQIEEIFLIDLFSSIFKNSENKNAENFNFSKFKNNFLTYIPMIYYSIIEYIFTTKTKNNNLFNNIQSNENFNFIIEIIKIYSHYLSNYYIEYLSKLPIEDSNLFIRDFLLHEIKIGSFFIRKNIREENILEKIVDTETLYTVFERC